MALDLYDGALEPIWFGDRKVYSVTGFTEGVRSQISGIPALWVQGEISDFKLQKHLGTVYFTLKDPENGFVLRCTIWRTRFESLGIEIQDGDKVQVFGRPDIYTKSGSFQLRAHTIEHTGRGLLMQQLEHLRARLADEGLFDESRKRELPAMPRVVGVITGADAAAQGDFVRNVTERFPPVRLRIVETLVQGERAAPQVLAALMKLQAMDDVDVIVVTRGGGAFEDFLPFSDERLCRAIAACRVPVVSAIGHEKDSPISDLVADLRVSTPTAAARIVVPDAAQLTRGLERARLALERRVRDRLTVGRQRDVSLRARLTARSPQRLVLERRGYISALRFRAGARVAMTIELRRSRLTAFTRARDGLGRRVARESDRTVATERRLTRAATAKIHTIQRTHDQRLAQLRALSPQGTLTRGYAIVRTADGTIVRAPTDAPAGSAVTMSVARGSLRAVVTEDQP